MAEPCVFEGNKQVQLRRGTTAENDAFTGALGELTFDTQSHRIRTHDGVTLGGFEHALLTDLALKEDLANKATDFSVVNHTLYPSVQATKTYADTKEPLLGFTPENVANKATDFSTVNHTLYPSVQAVKTYTDGLVVGLLDDRGGFDASANLFPATGGSGTAGAILKGDIWFISVAGTLGGEAVEIGDSVRALIDAPGQVAANWNILETNIGYVPVNKAGDTMTGDLNISTGIHLDTDGSAFFGTNTLQFTTAGLVLLPDGTEAAPALSFVSDPDTGIYRYGADQLAITAGVGFEPSVVVQSTGLWLGNQDIRWSFTFAGDIDTILFRDNSLGIRQRVAGFESSAQLHLYNANWVDSLNWERINLEWNGNEAFLSTERLGSGSHRNLSLGSEGLATVSLRTNAINWYTLSTVGLLVGTKSSIGSTPTDNLQLTNATAAAAGAQQYSPALRLTGQGWKTNATAASQATDWRVYNQPVQGAANPTSNLLFDFSVNGGAFATRLTLGSDGALSFVDGVRQTFNPDGTNAGLNVGSVAGDPASPVDGDLWYNSVTTTIRARANGTSISLIAPPFLDTNTLIRGSADATKLLRFEIDGFSAGTTRVLTPPDADITIAGLQVSNSFTVQQNFDADAGISIGSMLLTDPGSAGALNIDNGNLEVNNGFVRGLQLGVSTPPVDTTMMALSGFEATGADDSAMVDIQGTWDTTGAPVGLRLNAIDNASDAASLLLVLNTNGSPVFAVGKTGLVSWADGVRQTFNPDGTNAGLNVGSQAGDPSAPSNGDIWYNSTQARLKSRIEGITQGLGSKGWMQYNQVVGTARFERYYIAGMAAATAMATLATATGTFYAMPFIAGRGGTVDRLAFAVTTGAGAGGVGRAGIYDAVSDIDPYPNALVVDGGEFTVTGNGMKTATINQVLVPNKLYFLVVLFGTAAPTVRAVNPAGGAFSFFGADNAFGTVLGHHLTVAQAYGSLPGTFPSGGAINSAAVLVPAVGVRFSA